MNIHRQHWRCTERHGITREFADPGYWETKCECGKVIRHYVNHIAEGDLCHHLIPWFSIGSMPERCMGTMVLEHDEIIDG